MCFIFLDFHMNKSGNIRNNAHYRVCVIQIGDSEQHVGRNLCGPEQFRPAGGRRGINQEGELSAELSPPVFSRSVLGENSCTGATRVLCCFVFAVSNFHVEL